MSSFMDRMNIELVVMGPTPAPPTALAAEVSRVDAQLLERKARGLFGVETASEHLRNAIFMLDTIHVERAERVTYDAVKARLRKALVLVEAVTP